MRTGAKSAFFTLMLPFGLACSNGNPCYDADKTSDPRDDIRVLLFMNGGPANLKAVFALEAGANPNTSVQSQTCSPVSTDKSLPTNVVFEALAGDVVTLEL